VADGVHARKAPVKDPVPDVRPESTLREPKPEELPSGDDGVASKREPRQTWVT
jgi:hypothetical protein